MLLLFSALGSWCRRALSAPVAILALVALMAPGAMRATTVEPPDFATLVNDCDYIVRATIKSVTAEKQNSPYGVRIVTHVELTVLETVAGHPPASVTLRQGSQRSGDGIDGGIDVEISHDADFDGSAG